ncbi:unnamed protein product [Colias eurytheme]|nr:unnamed protein product [Colias eurytheme]
MLLDSDTDNSLIISNNRQKKKCLKNTPAKKSLSPDKKSLKYDTNNMSYESINSAESGDDTDEDEDDGDDDYDDSDDEVKINNSKVDKNYKTKNDSQDHEISQNDSIANESTDAIDTQKRESVHSIDNDSDATVDYDNDDHANNKSSDNAENKHESGRKSSVNADTDGTVDDDNAKNNSKNEADDNTKHKDVRKISINSKDNDTDGTEDYDYSKGDESKDKSNKSEDDENDDQMFMSRATRMSIMGIVPKDNESDDSDYIQSDNSRPSSSASMGDLPDTGINVTKTQSNQSNVEDSRISCSPFSSPLRDVTNTESPKNDSYNSSNSAQNDVVDLTQMIEPDLKSTIKKRLNAQVKENMIDDDVTIIDTKPEVIALSSDSEDDDLKIEKTTTPTIKKSPKREKQEATKKLGSDIKQYLVPPSYPNQVVYVMKHVRENELNKLNGLKEDLQGVKLLLDTMDLNTLPDGGVKLIERLTALEAEVRNQGDKVANMVVIPDNPTPADIAKDGFENNEKGLSWDELQKVSNAVQPRMFGKQAMATHMAERNVIMDRLRDLYESLASRPSEETHAPQPRAVRTPLMPHQLHALAWLLWRETQRPSGGILADDMGLGKTITMISLMACDKEKNLDDDESDEEDRGKTRAIRGGTLVVCPASLMSQWAGEVGKHCAPHALTVSQHHGAHRTAQAHRLAQHDLVLTTYNILQRESEKNGVLTRVVWRRVILDEAHAVRNHKAATSVAVSALRARRRWALTGTPLHNKDLDLFALLKFLKCTPFDELTVGTL